MKKIQSSILTILIILTFSYSLPEIQKTKANSLEFSLREHKTYASYNPDFTWTREGTDYLRMTSSNPSMGAGYMFIVVPRDWLNGKYVRFRWQGYASYGATVFHVFIYDGSYDRSSDTDFPSGSNILIKGNGLLQTMIQKTGSFAIETQDIQAVVDTGTQEDCTIFFWLAEGWSGQNFWLQLDWFEINQESGGSGNLWDEQFTDAPVMEVTGTYGDYGYCSTGHVTLAYATLFFTPHGKFLTETTLVTNGSEYSIPISGINLVGAPDNGTMWMNFTVVGITVITTNNYNYTSESNVTIWCYFEVPEVPEEPYIVGRFKHSPSRPYVGETITFNASYSQSSETITSYNWTFGDGNTASGNTTTHAYASPGLYDVNLTVSSPSVSDTFIIQLNVTDYYSPFARFVFEPENPSAGQQVTFNASSSEDKDGEITSYSWKFGDEGIANEETASHSFTSPGLYDVNLTVTDSQGKKDSWICKVNVTGNESPIARFTCNPSAPFPLRDVVFDGAESLDVDGTIMSYEWNFGDGATATGVTATHQYTYAGLYYVNLTVTDDKGATDSFTRKFYVQGGGGLGKIEVSGLFVSSSLTTHFDLGDCVFSNRLVSILNLTFVNKRFEAAAVEYNITIFQGNKTLHTVNDVVMVDGKDRLTLVNGEHTLNCTLLLPVSDSPTDILDPSNYDVKATITYKDEPVVFHDKISVPVEYKLIRWGIPAGGVALFAILIVVAWIEDKRIHRERTRQRT
jgi:PKD repeat protein